MNSRSFFSWSWVRLGFLLLVALASSGGAWAQSLWQAQDVAIGADGRARLLWTRGDGRADLWTLGTAGNVETSYSAGPFPGVTAKAIAVDGAGNAKLMWVNTDGSMCLYQISAAGTYQTERTYGPFSGWKAIDVTCGSDNITRVLWRHESGQIAFWKVGADSSLPWQANVNYGPFAGWTAQKIAVDAAGQLRVMWVHNDSTLALWKTTPDSTFDSQGIFGPYSGWTPSDVAVGTQTGGDGTSRVLWNDTNGACSLWKIDAAGNAVSHIEHGPFDGWRARAIAVDANDTTRVLWNHTSGAVALWRTQSNNDFASFDAYNYTPTNVTASSTSSAITLSWAASPHAASYKITRQQSASGALKVIEVAGTSYTDTAVVPGVTYFYRVKSRTREVESADSAPASAQTSTSTASSGKIAFLAATASAPNIQEIWLTNADGRNRTQLTKDGTYSKAEPRWNRDGTKLVFSGAVPTASRYDTPKASSIFTINADGSGFARVTQQYDSSGESTSGGGRWNPDSSKIVFTHANYNSVYGNSYNQQIYVMDANGSNPVNCTGNFLNYQGGPSLNSGPEWSPDGGKILFHHADDAASLSCLATMNPDGSGQAIISRRYGASPQWSPDSRRIVFDSPVPAANGNGNSFDLFVMNADGSGTVDITPNGRDNYGPQWSPDGSRIVFNLVTGSSRDIYVINADGSGAVNLTNSPMYTYAGISQGWNPESTRIVFQTSGYYGSDGDIVTEGAGGGGLVNLTNNVTEDSQPQWTIGSVPAPSASAPRASSSESSTKKPSAGSS